jgi:hypothetical protein
MDVRLVDAFHPGLTWEPRAETFPSPLLCAFGFPAHSRAACLADSVLTKLLFSSSPILLCKL